MNYLNYATFVVSLVAIGLSIWAKFQAHTANKLSRQSLKLQERLAPQVWSDLQHLHNFNYQLSNHSGKDIEILEILGEPKESNKLVRFCNAPVVVSRDDKCNITIASTHDRKVTSILIRWRYKDASETDTHETRRNVN